MTALDTESFWCQLDREPFPGTGLVAVPFQGALGRAAEVFVFGARLEGEFAGCAGALGAEVGGLVEVRVRADDGAVGGGNVGAVSCFDVHGLFLVPTNREE